MTLTASVPRARSAEPRSAGPRSAGPRSAGLGAFKSRLAEILRVDHAGELGAVYIYRGQRAVLDRRSPETKATLAHMEAQERHHLETFETLLTERGVRPTLMSPLWRLAAFGMGAATALISERAAHACTEAVETVIEAHYADQIAELRTREPELVETIQRFRAEEIEHLDEAVDKGARDAPGYTALFAIITAACKTAIKVSEKV